MTLHESPYGGTTATVLLPEGVLANLESQEPEVLEQADGVSPLP
ncbi:hypothetical protein ACR6C2_09240 [Streptomyces sp. INA 01156]